MVIISHKHKYIYYPIPKVASTDILRMLASWEVIGLFQTESMDEAAELHTGGYKSFAFVRNPLDRLVAGYESVRDEKTPSFNQFARDICLTPDNQLDGIFRSQSSMLPPRGQIDFIGLYDWLDHDMENLQRWLPIPFSIRLPRERQGRRSYKSYYTPGLVRLVKDRYREDFDL